MLKIDKQIKWISSLGGPLILVDRKDLRKWKGDSASSISDPAATDYDRAGEIADFIGYVKAESSKLLVLGDLPSHTTVFRIDFRTLLFVRWIWASSEEQVRNSLLELDLTKVVWNDSSDKISFASGDLTLFDSVYAGDEDFDSLRIRVEPGDYDVATFAYNPLPEISLFLILVKKEQI